MWALTVILYVQAEQTVILTPLVAMTLLMVRPTLLPWVAVVCMGGLSH